MPQFDVHRLDDTYLLDCQSDQLDGLNSRIVVPLIPVGTVTREFPRLTPRLSVGQQEFIMATHLMAAVDRRILGPSVASLAQERYTIQTAIDILTGSG
jgi:toxin CcdB